MGGTLFFVNISYKNAAVLGKGHGKNPLSAGKGFSPCNCPTKLDFRAKRSLCLDFWAITQYDFSMNESRRREWQI